MWLFAVDLTAMQTAHLLELNRKTVNRYYGLFRAQSTGISAGRLLHL